MAWHIVAAHHIAHLQPTLTQGTATTGFAVGNARTLNVNQRASITSSGANGIKLDWDRGAGTPTAINCVLILQNNMSGANWNVIADGSSGFSIPTTLIAATSSPTVDIYKRFDSSATSIERYLRFHYNQTSGVYEFGVISFGVAYQAVSKVQLSSETITANPQGGPHYGDGYRSWMRSFLFTRAAAETILRYASKYYINNAANTAIDAIGGGGGKMPIALVDDSTSPATVYYGPARVSAKAIASFYTEIFVETDLVERGLF